MNTNPPHQSCRPQTFSKADDQIPALLQDVLVSGGHCFQNRRKTAVPQPHLCHNSSCTEQGRRSRCSLLGAEAWPQALTVTGGSAHKHKQKKESKGAQSNMMVSRMEVRVDLSPQGLLRDRARVVEDPKGWLLSQQTEKVGGGIDSRRQNMNKGQKKMQKELEVGKGREGEKKGRGRRRRGREEEEAEGKGKEKQ